MPKYGFYNESHIKNGRTNKTCYVCDNTIVKGTEHYVVPNPNMEYSMPICLECYNGACKDMEDTHELIRLYGG